MCWILEGLWPLIFQRSQPWAVNDYCLCTVYTTLLVMVNLQLCLGCSTYIRGRQLGSLGVAQISNQSHRITLEFKTSHIRWQTDSLKVVQLMGVLVLGVSQYVGKLPTLERSAHSECFISSFDTHIQNLKQRSKNNIAPRFQTYWRTCND